MGCGCRQAKSVVRDTLRRDALARGVPLVEGETCERPIHASQVGALVQRVSARPGLRLQHRLSCGCAVVVR